MTDLDDSRVRRGIKRPGTSSNNQTTKQHRTRKPPSLYGYDWRLCMLLTQTVHTYLRDNALTTQSPNCSINWVIISVMMANACAITAAECRMLWKTIAYDIDEDGHTCSKRLSVDDDDVSDIDSDLPALKHCKPCDIDQLSVLRMDCFNNGLEWNDSLDLTLLNVVYEWTSRKRHQSSNQSNNRPIKQSIDCPVSIQIQHVIPTTLDDWRAISTMFKNLGGISKSPSFLQSRFSMLTRTVFTVDRGSRRSINPIPDFSTKIRTIVLQIMGVENDEELVTKALHNTSLNYSPNAITRRRRPKTRQRDVQKYSNNPINHSTK